ncbi:hypothetical protein EDB81DRAFT_586686, partial [Dactylonectria macrodidyma]
RYLNEYLNSAVKSCEGIRGKAAPRLAVKQFRQCYAMIQEGSTKPRGHIAFDGTRNLTRHVLFTVTAGFRDTETQ